MKIKSGNDLNWEQARKAAQAIIKQCDDAGFTPPEAVDIHIERVNTVCSAMDAIVDALRLRAGSGDKPGRVEPK